MHKHFYMIDLCKRQNISSAWYTPCGQVSESLTIWYLKLLTHEVSLIRNSATAFQDENHPLHKALFKAIDREPIQGEHAFYMTKILRHSFQIIFKSKLKHSQTFHKKY